MLTAQAHVIKSSMTLVGRQIGTFARKQAPTHFYFECACIPCTMLFRLRDINVQQDY
jgi:hypothetical protein